MATRKFQVIYVIYQFSMSQRTYVYLLHNTPIKMVYFTVQYCQNYFKQIFKEIKPLLLNLYNMINWRLIHRNVFPPAKHVIFPLTRNM